MYTDKPLNESFYIKQGLLVDLIQELPNYLAEYSALVLCTNGSMVISIENEITNISKNQLIGFKPFLSIKEIEISSDCEVTILAVHNNLTPQITDKIKALEPLYILNLSFYSKIDVTEKQMSEINQLIQFFFEKINAKDSILKHQKSNAIFTVLLYEIIDLFIHNKIQNSRGLTKAKLITSDFVTMLNTNINQKKGVEYFAEKLNITPKHLISSVKSITKETPRKMIDKMILNQAKKLLIKKEKSIQEIAEQLGFSDASAFTKFFKRNQGETPKNYQNNNYTMVN